MAPFCYRERCNWSTFTHAPIRKRKNILNARQAFNREIKSFRSVILNSKSKQKHYIYCQVLGNFISCLFQKRFLNVPQTLLCFFFKVFEHCIVCCFLKFSPQSCTLRTACSIGIWAACYVDWYRQFFCNIVVL